MAESPAHTFGQYLGNLLEALFLPELEEFCERHSLYLDKHGVRPARPGKKATWIDLFGNSHDLDFVIEKDGTPTVQGRPLAFIEAAWRRYTKHSKNKAQEIQGAVLPLAETYQWDKPFKGAILAGCFTDPSIAQMESLGFDVVYIRYESLIDDFARNGIDIRFGETTEGSWFVDTIAQIGAGGADLQGKIITSIRASNRKQFDAFFDRLKAKLMRHVDKLIIVPLFGDEVTFGSVGEALTFLQGYNSEGGGGAFRGFEVIVRYSNGDHLNGSFENHADVEKFLKYVGS